MLNDISNRILCEMEENQFIPRQFVKYTKYILNNKIDGKYYQVLLDTPSAVIRDIGILLRDTGNIVGLSSEELLKHSSFNRRDYNPSKVPSLFAEFRAIKYLNAEGFTNIQILQEAKIKRADFSASKNGYKFAIEVTNAGYEASEGRWHNDDIVVLLLNKLIVKEKYKQLKVTRDIEGYDKMALILVIDKEDKVALNTSEDYLNILKESWEQFGKNIDLHLCIVTGRKALGYGNDDSVYPPWEKEG